MTYDDLLTRLDHTLSDKLAGLGAAARLRERYRVVLVDEFQDTDPVQWHILRHAFADAGVTLVLVGDPKQAIYAFRGADVYAYLDAAASADTHADLAVNWRTDQRLIDAYDLLFADVRLGHEGIIYRQVHAAAPNLAPRLTAAPVDTPLRVRVVRRDEPSIRVTPRGFASNAATRAHIARDLAADVVALLSSDSTIEARDADGEPVRRESVCPGHVAVLVRTHRQAAMIRDALDDLDVPAVINGAGSVFATPASRDWLRLLQAIERPASSARARAASLTPFLGWTAEQLCGADDAELEELHRRIHLWARLLREQGIASLLQAITVTEGLPARILSFEDGERALTDVRHVGQLLHAAATTQHLGASALTAWLRQRVGAAAEESGDEERSRRLESDDEAVQVLTIHRSKGLEFPIVYVPYLWEPGYIPRGARPVFFHDSENCDARTVDVGLGGPDFARHQREHEHELRGEDLRLAYVALSRARHQAVLWWAGSYDSRHAPLTRLLFSRTNDGNIAPAGVRTPADAEVVERLEALAAMRPGRMAVERAALRELPRPWGGNPTSVRELAPARFERSIDTRWARTSYSGITAEAHEAWVGSEHEGAVMDDEPEGNHDGLHSAVPGVPEPSAHGTHVVSAWDQIPANVHLGTFVHGVLAEADFNAPDLHAELGRRVAARAETRSAGALVDALALAIETPLGTLVGGSRLRDLSRQDRLDELAFELPLAGGNEVAARVTLSALATVLNRHAGATGPIASYAERLGDRSLRQELRGYLTGSIDLVARVAGHYGEPSFVVIDYKTNWLGPPGNPLTTRHHTLGALTAEMNRAHYVLQGLLYSVALHRYLRWRLRDYDPARHLVGVAYLFLRGMVGPATPVIDGTPTGVFAWRPRPTSYLSSATCLTVVVLGDSARRQRGIGNPARTVRPSTCAGSAGTIATVQRQWRTHRG